MHRNYKRPMTMSRPVIETPFKLAWVSSSTSIAFLPQLPRCLGTSLTSLCCFPGNETDNHILSLSRHCVLSVVCFAYVIACCVAFCSRKCLGKILFFLGSVFESALGSELPFLLLCCALVFFGGVLPLFLFACWVFSSRKCLAKIFFFFFFFFLGSGFETHFWERISVFIVFLL